MLWVLTISAIPRLSDGMETTEPSSHGCSGTVGTDTGLATMFRHLRNVASCVSMIPNLSPFSLLRPEMSNLVEPLPDSGHGRENPHTVQTADHQPHVPVWIKPSMITASEIR